MCVVNRLSNSRFKHMWRCCIAASAVLVASAAIAETPVSNEEAVATLLRLRCAKCHGPLHPKAELNLSTFRGLARGGESGFAVVPTHADESLLWLRVEADEMPPEMPLKSEEKSLLKNWIEQGAPGLPRGELPEPIGADHWAFQKLMKPELPNVTDSSRIRTSIDRFVQANLEAHQLRLSPDSDRRTLIRRVAFDLTGLPPTPDEIAEFLADTASNAYEQMIDRYLASPRYGERWGQYWLDAAGYADSSGYFSLEFDRPLAWRYRDFVIASFNQDKPFDQFVKEQLAGDELVSVHLDQEILPDQMQALVATHFLRNAPDGTDQSAPSPEAMRSDRYAALEGTQQVVASSLLALSLKCAKCHDHKFEPISQQEYYQVQSLILPALNPQNWTPPLKRKVRVALPGDKAAWQTELAKLNAAQEKLTAEKVQLQTEAESLQGPKEVIFADVSAEPASVVWSAAAPGDDPPAQAPTIDKEQPGGHSVLRDGKQLRLIAGFGPESWVSTKQTFDWTPDKPGQSIQVTFDLVSDQTDVSGKPSPAAKYFGYYLAMHDFYRRKTKGGNVLIDGQASGAATVYLNYPGTKVQTKVIGGEKYVAGKNYGVRVTNVGDNKLQLIHLVDGLSDGEPMTITAADLPDGGFGFYLGAGRSFVVENVTISIGNATESLSAEARTKLDAGNKRRQAIEQELKKLDEQINLGAGTDVAWTTDATPRPPEVFLLKRGLYGDLGDAVQPSALSVLTDTDNPLSVIPPANGRSSGRRLALANWLTRSGSRPSALMARVQANRIWLHHFGVGIVSTPDNLGLSGSPPTNPALLEFLAATLIENGWQQKAMHRLILTSTAYRQQSVANADGLQRDPNNRWWWRFPLRRLEGEALRDAMLAVSGELDLTTGGPYVSIDRKANPRDTGSGAVSHEIIIPETTPGARRRSIYLEHCRGQLPTFLALFDTPVISVNCVERTESNVPLQSLAQLNSEFVRLRSRAMAKRLDADVGDSLEGKIRRAFLLAFAREPDTHEQRQAEEFVMRIQQKYPSEQALTNAITDFCQTIFCSNSFLHLE
jgi:hypothetical protein